MLSRSHQPATAALNLRLRLDLRSGKLCGASLRCAPSMDSSFQGLIDQAQMANTRWRRISASLPLHITLPFAQLTHPEQAAHLDASLAGNGFSPENVQLEIDESAFALGNGVSTALEKLRGRGWSLGLRGADRPSLALDARTRSLFSALILSSSPSPATPAQAPDDDAFQRIDAAKAAGWSVVLQTAPAQIAPAWLIAAGFDAYESHLGPGQ